MSERDEAATLFEDLTPAELADRIAHSLARLAHLVAKPEAVQSLPSIAAELAAMAVDQAALAWFLKRDEAGAPTAEQIGAEAAILAEALGPEGAAADAQSAEPIGATPLTFEALNLAVELLTRDAQTRIWPAQEAAELPGLVAEAVATVQDATRALHAFLLTQGRAAGMRGRLVVDERGQPAREPAELQSAYVAAEGARALVEAFADMKAREAGEPLARIVSALANVQNGNGDPLFTPLKKYAGGRHIDAATVIGLAAAAMDAWQCAGLSRPEAAKRVASLFGGVRRHGGSMVAGVQSGTVAWWRDQAKAERLTPKDAQGRWGSYRTRRDARHATHPDAHTDRSWHEQHALALEGRIAAILANQGPGFTLIGKGREPDRPPARGRRPRTKIRESTAIHSNGSRG